MPPLTGSAFCFAHDPTAAAARAAARRRGGAAHAAATATGELPRLKSVPDVQRHLEQLLGDTLLQSNSARRTAAIVSILSLALKAIEVGSFEERLANLEKLAGGKWPTTHAA